LRLAGLSIEEGTVRAAIINRLPGRTVNVRSTAFELKEGDEATRASEFRLILEHLRDEDSVRGIVVGLGMTTFSHHYITLPLTKRADIMHALGFELEKHLPLPPDEYVFDFITVSRSDEGSKLLVLSVLRSRLAWIRQDCEAVGLVLAGIRCTPVEAMNEFASANEADGVLFVHRGHDVSCIFGMKDTAPASLRVIRNNAPSLPDINEMSAQYDSGSFSVAEPEVQAMEGLEAKELDYQMPVILARSAIRKRRFDLQFTSGTGAGATPLWQEQAPAVLGVLCLLVFLMTTLVSYYKDNSALRHISSELQEMESQSSKLIETREEIDSINARKQYLEAFRSKRNLYILALREMSVRLPDTAWLTGFTIDEHGKVQIQGYAVRASEIIRPLDASSLFRNVEFSSPVTISAGRERFSIRMEME